MQKVSLPGQYKRVAALIDGKNLRRAYIKAMIDAESTYQYQKKRTGKERQEDRRESN